MASIPHVCPVCKGKGEIPEELAQHNAHPKYALPDSNIFGCHVCLGVCLVWEFTEDPKVKEEPTVFLPTINIPGGVISNPPTLIGIPPFTGQIGWTVSNNTDPVTIYKIENVNGNKE